MYNRYIDPGKIIIKEWNASCTSPIPIKLAIIPANIGPIINFNGRMLVLKMHRLAMAYEISKMLMSLIILHQRRKMHIPIQLNLIKS